MLLSPPGAAQAVESHQPGGPERQASPGRQPPPARHPRVRPGAEAGILSGPGRGVAGPRLGPQDLRLRPGAGPRRPQALGHRHTPTLAQELPVGESGPGEDTWFLKNPV